MTRLELRLLREIAALPPKDWFEPHREADRRALESLSDAGYCKARLSRGVTHYRFDRSSGVSIEAVALGLL